MCELVSLLARTEGCQGRPPTVLRTVNGFRSRRKWNSTKLWAQLRRLFSPDSRELLTHRKSQTATDLGLSLPMMAPIGRRGRYLQVPSRQARGNPCQPQSRTSWAAAPARAANQGEDQIDDVVGCSSVRMATNRCNATKRHGQLNLSAEQA